LSGTYPDPGFAADMATQAELDAVSAAAVPAPEDGWLPAGETLVYASADAPTFTFTIAGVDRTTRYTPGTRIKLSQTTVKYFIVTKVAFSTNTTVTVYGGTDYTLANAAITLPYFSRAKAPGGFPLDPAKWTVTTSDSTYLTQSSPAASTWYNPGSLSISIPIGAWLVDYQAQGYAQTAAVGTGAGMQSTLSTANNSETDKEFGTFIQWGGASNTGVNMGTFLSRQKHLVLTAKTTYFLNAATGYSMQTIGWYGSICTTKIRAVCAYL
jgi:hypothetical protein